VLPPGHVSPEALRLAPHAILFGDPSAWLAIGQQRKVELCVAREGLMALHMVSRDADHMRPQAIEGIDECLIERELLPRDRLPVHRIQDQHYRVSHATWLGCISWWKPSTLGRPTGDWWRRASLTHVVSSFAGQQQWVASIPDFVTLPSRQHGKLAYATRIHQAKEEPSDDGLGFRDSHSKGCSGVH
jgi:hypothetical protein